MTPRLLITFTLFIGLGLFLYSLNLPYKLNFRDSEGIIHKMNF